MRNEFFFPSLGYDGNGILDELVQRSFVWIPELKMHSEIFSNVSGEGRLNLENYLII